MTNTSFVKMFKFGFPSCCLLMFCKISDAPEYTMRNFDEKTFCHALTSDILRPDLKKKVDMIVHNEKNKKAVRET